MLLAFKALADAKVPRKRLILGHMSDFPGSDSKYRKAYASARPIADQVVFVGDHSHRSKASQKDRDEGRFLAFATPFEVAEHIGRTATSGELVLIKGSSDLHLERIALSWTGDVKCWVPICGLRESCQACGLYGTPYEITAAEGMAPPRTPAADADAVEGPLASRSLSSSPSPVLSRRD